MLLSVTLAAILFLSARPVVLTYRNTPLREVYQHRTNLNHLYSASILQEIPHIEERTKSLPVSELVVKASNSEEVLQAVESLVLPGEEASHAEQQLAYKRKRLTTSLNALRRLVKFLIGVSSKQYRQEILTDARFQRISESAFKLLDAKEIEDKTTCTAKDFPVYCEAVKCAAALGPFPEHLVCRDVIPLMQALERFVTRHYDAHQPTISQSPGGITIRASDITTLNWASKKLQLDTYDEGKEIFESFQRLEKELELPFEVLNGATEGLIDTESVRRTVPFQAETIVTKSGKKVKERRETCWMADPGVGGLAYSGKIMTPTPFVGSVAAVRDELEALMGIKYDCCLINWYPDAACGCKFHSDPDHGRLWDRNTVVVSIGETRRFNFRRILDGGAEQESEKDHHSFHLKDGDVVYMFDDCQDSYQHCVMSGEGEDNNAPRASLVFKKSIPQVGGRRGHGGSGVARRSSSLTGSNQAHDKPSQGRGKAERKQTGDRTADRTADRDRDGAQRRAGGATKNRDSSAPKSSPKTRQGKKTKAQPQPHSGRPPKRGGPRS